MVDNNQKILVNVDFNFPDLTWNSNIIHIPITSFASNNFRELVYDFFLQQMNMHSNILDLILTNAPESVIWISLVTKFSCSTRLTNDPTILMWNGEIGAIASWKYIYIYVYVYVYFCVYVFMYICVYVYVWYL